ncbi:MAG: hypothetical protein JRG71_16610 [Deltaproteobacteria bacterium]|nr:hypothetical protein [Deltaproteobacteria bacterium]
MLGLEGTMVPLGLILTLASTIVCVVYGIRNWNKGYITKEELASEAQWDKEQAEVDKQL